MNDDDEDEATVKPARTTSGEKAALLPERLGGGPGEAKPPPAS